MDLNPDNKSPFINGVENQERVTIEAATFIDKHIIKPFLSIVGTMIRDNLALTKFEQENKTLTIRLDAKEEANIEDVIQTMSSCCIQDALNMYSAWTNTNEYGKTRYCIGNAKLTESVIQKFPSTATNQSIYGINVYDWGEQEYAHRVAKSAEQTLISHLIQQGFQYIVPPLQPFRTNVIEFLVQLIDDKTIHLNWAFIACFKKNILNESFDALENEIDRQLADMQNKNN